MVKRDEQENLLVQLSLIATNRDNNQYSNKKSLYKLL